MTAPCYQITLIYTEALLKQSVLRFCKRTLGWRYLSVLSVTLIGLLIAFVYKNTSWETGLLAIVFTASIVFALSLYLTQKKNVLNTFFALEHKQIIFTLYQDSFSLSSDLGEGSWPWNAIQEVWIYPNSWLVFFGKASYATFPLTDMTQEIQTFILTKLNDASALIK